MRDVLEFWIHCKCSKWTPSTSEHCRSRRTAARVYTFFWATLYIYIYIYLHASRHSIFLIYYTNCGHRLSTNCVLPNSVVIMDLIDCFSTFSSLCINRRPLRSGSPTLATSCGFEVVFGQLLARVTIFNALSLLL